MGDFKLPVITGEKYQIFKATQEDGIWHVHAKLGNVERNVEVRGTAEHVLQVINALSKLPEKVASLQNRARFIVKDGQILGSGIMAIADRVHPFHLRVFQKNS